MQAFVFNTRREIFKDRILDNEPERGDIIVFKTPSDNRTDYIKRLIGLPGDEISIKDGRLWINKKEIPTQQMADFVEKKENQGPLKSIPRCSNSPVALEANCLKSQFIEKITDQLEVKVLDISSGEYGDNTTSFKVPEGEFFFLGDNRDNSLDSRFGRMAGAVSYTHLTLPTKA
mgnify:CR=1 FL=1